MRVRQKTEDVSELGVEAEIPVLCRHKSAQTAASSTEHSFNFLAFGKFVTSLTRRIRKAFHFRRVLRQKCLLEFSTSVTSLFFILYSV